MAEKITVKKSYFLEKHINFKELGITKKDFANLTEQQKVSIAYKTLQKMNWKQILNDSQLSRINSRPLLVLIKTKLSSAMTATNRELDKQNRVHLELTDYKPTYNQNGVETAESIKKYISEYRDIILGGLGDNKITVKPKFDYKIKDKNQYMTKFERELGKQLTVAEDKVFWQFYRDMTNNKQELFYGSDNVQELVADYLYDDSVNKKNLLKQLSYDLDVPSGLDEIETFKAYFEALRVVDKPKN